MSEISCGTKKPNEELDRNYWNAKWEQRETGWDIGYSSPAIEEYMLQYPDKNARILIPGCGNAYEATFLLENGFSDITILDIAPLAVEVLQKKFKYNPEIKVICGDFFEHTEKYDLMIEQTFFCAISPLLRKEYVQKASELLNENGRIIGVMFNRNFAGGPPFSGSAAEYEFLFRKNFEIHTLEPCTNSIVPRQGSEVFVNFKKKKQ